jgi:hypothetical protein
VCLQSPALCSSADLCRAVVCVFTIVVLFYIMQSFTGIPVPEPPRDFHFEYEVLKGYFKQSEEDTNDKDFDFVSVPAIPFFLTRQKLMGIDQRGVWPC